MNVPLVVSFAYLILGMLTTVMMWSKNQLEIEAAISFEEDEVQGVLRVLLMVTFVVAWPVILVDMMRDEE